MPTVIPEGYAHCSLKLALTGDPEPMFVTFGLDLNDNPPENCLRRAVYEFYGPEAAGSPARPIHALSSSYTFQGGKLLVGSAAGQPTVVELSTSQIGRNTAAALPQNTSVLVKKQTALAGREGRGRMFVPGIPETSVDSAGVINASGLTEWQNGWGNYLLALGAATGPNPLGDASPTTMVILHTSPQLGVIPAPTIVTSLSVDSRCATQRRRLRR